MRNADARRTYHDWASSCQGPPQSVWQGGQGCASARPWLCQGLAGGCQQAFPGLQQSQFLALDPEVYCTLFLLPCVCSLGCHHQPTGIFNGNLVLKGYDTSTDAHIRNIFRGVACRLVAAHQSPSFCADPFPSNGMASQWMLISTNASTPAAPPAENSIASPEGEMFAVRGEIAANSCGRMFIRGIWMCTQPGRSHEAELEWKGGWGGGGEPASAGSHVTPGP